MRVLEERFLTRNPESGESGIGRKPTNDAPVEMGGDTGGTMRAGEVLSGGVSAGREGIYVPEVDNTLRIVPAPDSKGLRSQENEAVQQFKYVDKLTRPPY